MLSQGITCVWRYNIARPEVTERRSSLLQRDELAFLTALQVVAVPGEQPPHPTDAAARNSCPR